MVDVYLLTEECPRTNSICTIIDRFIWDFLVQNKYMFTGGWSQFKESIHNNIYDYCSIEPEYITNPNNGKKLSFLFKYTFSTNYLQIYGIRKVYILGVTGESSFGDYLLYACDYDPSNLFYPLPSPKDTPSMIIEETKTSDKESRNTGVYQRAIKFAYAKNYYPKSKLYMLYNNEHNPDHSNPTATNIFGTNLLLTLGVTILGKEPYMSNYHRFTSIDELISAKNSMSMPRYGQPIRINYDKPQGIIFISCRLEKNNSISHDPNIGTVVSIAATLRELGYDKRIVITDHQISSQMIDNTKGNKFLFSCILFGIELHELHLPSITLPVNYWTYEKQSEKIASIYLHVLAEKYGCTILYHNHAGCERSYFLTNEPKYIAIPKVTEDDEKILIPDIIVKANNMVTIIEGKKLDTLSEGLNEVDSYDIFENNYINSKDYGYPGINIYRALTIYGGELQELPHERVLLYINNAGKIIVNPEAQYPWDIIFKEEGLMDLERN